MPEPTPARERVAKHRAAQRRRGLRAVVMWLPDVNNPAYRAQLTDESRRLSQVTRDEVGMAAGFTRLAAKTPGWR